MIVIPSYSLRKTVGKVSPILVIFTSRCDSDFESSNVSLEENKPDGVNSNSNDIYYYVRKNEGKMRRFLADCIMCNCLNSISARMSAVNILKNCKKEK